MIWASAATMWAVNSRSMGFSATTTLQAETHRFSAQLADMCAPADDEARFGKVVAAPGAAHVETSRRLPQVVELTARSRDLTKQKKAILQHLIAGGDLRCTAFQRRQPAFARMW